MKVNISKYSLYLSLSLYLIESGYFLHPHTCLLLYLATQGVFFLFTVFECAFVCCCVLVGRCSSSVCVCHVWLWSAPAVRPTSYRSLQEVQQPLLKATQKSEQTQGCGVNTGILMFLWHTSAFTWGMWMCVSLWNTLSEHILEILILIKGYV